MDVEYIGYGGASRHPMEPGRTWPTIMKLSLVVMLHGLACLMFMRDKAPLSRPAGLFRQQSDISVILIPSDPPRGRANSTRKQPTSPAPRVADSNPPAASHDGKSRRTYPTRQKEMSKDGIADSSETRQAAPAASDNDHDPDAGSALRAAIKLAGRIDKELHGAGFAKQRFAPSRMEQLGASIENAYIDRSTHERRQMFETADGIVYYRFTKRGKSTCLMGGASGPASPIQCPDSAAGWPSY